MSNKVRRHNSRERQCRAAKGNGLAIVNYVAKYGRYGAYIVLRLHKRLINAWCLSAVVESMMT